MVVVRYKDCDLKGIGFQNPPRSEGKQWRNNWTHTTSWENATVVSNQRPPHPLSVGKPLPNREGAERLLTTFVLFARSSGPEWGTFRGPV